MRNAAYIICTENNNTQFFLTEASRRARIRNIILTFWRRNYFLILAHPVYKI